MLRAFFAISICSAMLILTGCKKSGKENPPTPPIKIEGFQLFDFSGNAMGRIGPPDSDWQFISYASLSDLEKSLLNLPDTTNSLNTLVSNVSVNPYPNPVSQASSIYLTAADSVKFKLTITDSTGVALKQVSRKVKGAAFMTIDLSDKSLYTNGKSLRYYYSFSAATSPLFKIGFGDIKICEYNTGSQPVTVCFQ